MNIIYHSMPTKWKNKIIEQELNCGDSTVNEICHFSDSWIENFMPREDKKKSSMASKKKKEKNFFKKWKSEDSDSSVIESSEEFPIERRPIKK